MIEEELRGTGGRGGWTPIRIVVRVNNTAGGVEVGECALIGAVKKGGTLLDCFARIRLWQQGRGSRLVGLIDSVQLLGFNGKLGS